MTVAQLLKSAKTLPKRERERLVREILALENPARVDRPSGGRPARVTWPDVEARAKLIVGDRAPERPAVAREWDRTMAAIRGVQAPAGTKFS